MESLRERFKEIASRDIKRRGISDFMCFKIVKKFVA